MKYHKDNTITVSLLLFENESDAEQLEIRIPDFVNYKDLEKFLEKQYKKQNKKSCKATIKI